MSDDWDPADIPVLRVVPLHAMPWPHNPSRCRYVDRYRVLAAQNATRSGPGEWEQADQAASAELFASLTPAEFAACQYHRHDWLVVATVAIELMPEGLGRDALLDRIRRDRRIRKHDRRCVYDLLLGEPVDWEDGVRSLHNGQHRLCAMRAAGVSECPALGFPEPGTQYGEPMPAADHARLVVERFNADHP